MEELIDKAINGDEQAFNDLIHCMKNTWYRIAFLRLQNKDDVEDALSETIYRIYYNMKKLKELDYFKTWTIKVLINECNRVYRRNKRNKQIVEKVSKSYLNENTIDNIEANIDFNEMIKALNYEEKIVFVLYFFERYNSVEISKILKTSENTIRSRLKRGKEKIKKEYEKRGEI